MPIFYSLQVPNALILDALNPFRAPEPLPILKPNIVVPKNGFPVVKGLSQGTHCCMIFLLFSITEYFTGAVTV